MKTIPTLAIISTERSGTNFLCNCLRKLEGSAAFMELFAKGAVYGMSRYPLIADLIGEMIDHDITGDHDAELSRRFHEAPVKHIKLLNHAAAKEGRRIFSYKVFPDQTAISRLMIALKQDAVTPLFLVRRRLDCFISYQKALQSDVWENTDTTNQRSILKLAEFEDWASHRDRWYKGLFQKCQDAGLEAMVMHYERDIDVPAGELIERMRQVLETRGVDTQIKPDALDDIGFQKQDKNVDPFKKIANGDAFREQLIETGQLEYANGWALVAQDLSGPKKIERHVTREIEYAGAPDVKGPTQLGVLQSDYFHWTILDQPDLVTMSSVNANYLHLPEILLNIPELAGTAPGLHFLSPTWAIPLDCLDYIRSTLARFHVQFPKHRALLQASDEKELKTLQDAGIPSMQCNGSVYQDEDKFNLDHDAYPEIPMSDSLYIARLLPFKRHELCKKLDRPLFVYDPVAGENTDAKIADLHLLNPSSVFVNHILKGDAHHRLEVNELSRVARNARTGLCLSGVEGHMRTSIQMMLCGLPVVSTPSKGGRDRYYNDDTALIAAPEATAVAEGVATLIARNLSPETVRRRALGQIIEDREKFVAFANAAASDRFGPTTPTLNFDPFKGQRFRPSAKTEFINALRIRNGLAPLD